MDIAPLQSPRVEAANLGLDRLAASTQVSESEKVAEVSRAFEAVLLRQILSESQRPIFQSSSAGNSSVDGIYRDMVVNQMADDISKSGSFGLGKSLARELQRQSGPAQPPPAESRSAGPVQLKSPHHE
jgi:Rod binding domain-containing protein